MKEYPLYGIRKGETRQYMETLLLATENQEQIEQVKRLAAIEGWHSFRESIYDGGAPDFTKTLNI